MVTHSLECSDCRFSRISSACIFLKNCSINNVKRKQMLQVCNQKCGYSRRHQLLEVNNSPDSTKFLSRYLNFKHALNTGFGGALTYVLLYKEGLKYVLTVKLVLKCFVELGPTLQLSVSLTLTVSDIQEIQAGVAVFTYRHFFSLQTVAAMILQHVWVARSGHLSHLSPPITPHPLGAPCHSAHGITCGDTKKRSHL